MHYYYAPTSTPCFIPLMYVSKESEAYGCENQNFGDPPWKEGVRAMHSSDKYYPATGMDRPTSKEGAIPGKTHGILWEPTETTRFVYHLKWMAVMSATNAINMLRIVFRHFVTRRDSFKLWMVDIGKEEGSSSHFFWLRTINPEVNDDKDGTYSSASHSPAPYPRESKYCNQLHVLNIKWYLRRLSGSKTRNSNEEIQTHLEINQ